MGPGLLSDAEVFGPPSIQPSPAAAAPPSASVAIQPLPNVPGYISDPGYTPPAGQEANPAFQAPAIPLGGHSGELLSDHEVFGPTGGAPATDPRPTSESLGFGEGLNVVGKKVVDALSGKLPAQTMLSALPALSPMYALSAPLRSGEKAVSDYFGRQEQTTQPGQIGKVGGELLASAPFAMEGGPALIGAMQGALTSDAKDGAGMLRDTGFGALGGKVADKAMGAIGGILSPQVSPTLKTLLDAKIPLTPGQMAGGMFKRLEDGVTSIPIFGDLVKNAQARSAIGLNRAGANRALEPIGESLPNDVNTGRESIAYAGDRLSRGYNALLPTLTIKADPEVASAFNDLASRAAEYGVGDQFKNFILRTVKFAKGGEMSGQAMKDAEHDLGVEIGDFKSSSTTTDRKYAGILGDARQALRDLVVRNNPQAAEQLQNLNKGWANLAIVEDAAGRQGATEGVFSPSQLDAAVRKANTTVRKRGYARGEALMQDLSDAARATLPSSVPDSGSPLRHAIEAGVGIGVAKESGLLPGLARGVAVGTTLGLPYTKIGQDALNAFVRQSRPAAATNTADLLEKLRPLLSWGGATAAPKALPGMLPALPMLTGPAAQ